MVPVDPVADAEKLYRRVQKAKEGSDWTWANGRPVATSSAFLDRGNRPSVDRAGMNGDDPRKTQREPDDLIFSLVAEEVREEPIPKGDPPEYFLVDVEPAPEVENPAHAEIFIRAEKVNPGMATKLRDRLRRISTCVLPEVHAQNPAAGPL